MVITQNCCVAKRMQGLDEFSEIIQQALIDIGCSKPDDVRKILEQENFTTLQHVANMWHVPPSSVCNLLQLNVYQLGGLLHFVNSKKLCRRK